MAAATRHELDGPAGRLSWLRAGEAGAGGSPVLLVHPINLQAACWERVVAGLAPRRCVAPDLRGHGRSAADGPFGLAEWTADCVAVLDAAGIERAHVVGGSLGGTIAVALAAMLPERVASVTAIGSTLAVEGADLDAVVAILREKGVAGMFREVIPQISVAPGTSPELIEELLALANPNGPDTVIAIWQAVLATDARARAHDVRCPVLVVSGELDRTCPPEQARELAERTGGRLELIPGVGHLPVLESPDALLDLLRPHLAAAD
ncbi:MAG: alpha/beta fold hydrolase [Thermoleophilia bacterium]